MKIALCCIVKNENDYLDEYVNYYHDLGFDKIFIYDNNDINGENPVDIIGKYNFVEIINYRGLKVVQCKAYNECAKLHQKDFDWMAFFDADEFLEFSQPLKIGEYINTIIPKEADTIFINWCNYSDSNLLGNENNCDRSLVKRFTSFLNENEYPNGTIKSIIKLNNYIPKFIQPHFPNNLKICVNGDGILCNKATRIKTTYKNVKLNHYRKTIIEFFEHKYHRGFPDGNSNKCEVSWFWDYSKKTPEKEQIVNDFLKTGKINYNIQK